MFHHGIRVKRRFIKSAGFGVLFAGLLLIFLNRALLLLQTSPNR